MLLTYEEMRERAFEFYDDLQINIPKIYVDLAVRSLTMPQYAKEYQDKYGDTIGDHTALAHFLCWIDIRVKKPQKR